MFCGKAFAVSIVARRERRPEALPPKKVVALPSSKPSRSITGAPLGPMHTIGTSRTTRSVNRRCTESFDSESPFETVRIIGSMSAMRLSNRRQ